MRHGMKIGMAVVLSLMVEPQSWAVGAAGLTSQFVGTKALGQANAFVAQADDPSAIYFNPAGLTQLPGTQASVGAALLAPSISRSGAGVAEDSTASQLSALPMFYLTHAMNSSSDKPIVLGVGLNSPFGLTTEWSNTSSVRYVTTKSEFKVINVNPTVAMQVMPQLSIGLGANYLNLMNTTSSSMVNQQANGSSDGTQKLSGHGDGWGFNAGVHYKPSSAHSFGVSYRSQVKVPIKGSVELGGLDATNQTTYNFTADTYESDATSSFTLPQSVIAGYSFRPNDRWVINFDYEWTQWNVFQEQRVAFSETDPDRLAFLTNGGPANESITARQWRNVSSLATGLEYKISPEWQARGGYAYYQRTVPNDTYNPDIPDAAVHNVSVGLSRLWKSITIDAAFMAYIYDNRTITNTVGTSVGASVNGTYEAFIPGGSISLTYRFGR